MAATVVSAISAGLLILVPLASPASAAAGPLVTFATAAYPLGGYSDALAVGDLDEDSDMDVVAAYRLTSSIAVLLNDGTGAYGPPTAVAAGGTTPSDVVLVDVDGDSHLDAVTTNTATDNVSVLRGDGDGQLGNPTTYPVGDNPGSVAAGDLDGDSVVDLVVADAGPNVSVLLGAGDGTFSPRTDVTTLSGHRQLVLGDVTGDAIVDVVQAGGSSGNVIVLVGDGDGTFGAPVISPTAVGSANWVAIGDLNGDAFPDLAVTGSLTEVLLGNGDATFTRSGTYESVSCQCELAVGDLNGDTFTDIAVVGLGSPTGVSVIHGNGDGTFVPQVRFGTTRQTSDLVVADLNGDDRLDVAATTEAQTVDVLLNTPGLPQPPTIGSAVGGSGSATVSWTPPEDEGASPVTGYVVTPYDANLVPQPSQTFTSPATTQTLTGLTDGKVLTFRVAAINAVGLGQPSVGRTNAVVIGTVPPAPTMVKALPGDRSAYVSWIAPVASPPAGGYIVTPYEGDTPLTPITFVGKFTNRKVTGLTNGTAYRFTVRAGNGVGAGPESLPSNTVVPATVSPPTAPGWVSVGAGNAKVRLEWSVPVYDGGGPITGYVVTPYKNGVAQAPVTFASRSTVQSLTGLTNGASYRFRVAATNAAGTGQASALSTAVVPMAVPGAPGWVSVIAGNAKVRLEWSAPTSNGGGAITGYVVTPYKNGVAQAPVTFASASRVQALTGLTNGASYRFRVAAINAVGAGTSSPLSAAVTPSP